MTEEQKNIDKHEAVPSTVESIMSILMRPEVNHDSLTPEIEARIISISVKFGRAEGSEQAAANAEAYIQELFTDGALTSDQQRQLVQLLTYLRKK